jgi:hypothetical protein
MHTRGISGRAVAWSWALAITVSVIASVLHV